MEALVAKLMAAEGMKVIAVSDKKGGIHNPKGLDIAKALEWVRTHGWETICNRAGTTFRKLPDAARARLTERKAIDLILAQPSMIKRPILDYGRTAGRQLLAGFKPDLYAAALKVTD